MGRESRGAQRKGKMYGLLMAVLLLFPWSLVVLIAFRALRAARRRAIAYKPVEQIGHGS